MLTLVSEGFNNILLEAEDYAQMKKWIRNKLDGKIFEEQEILAESSNNYTLLYLKKNDKYEIMCVNHNVAYTFEQIFMQEDCPKLITVKALPKTIFVNMGNGKGNIQAVVDKIISELGGEKITYGTAYNIPISEGVLISFLKDNSNEYEAAYEESIYLNKSYFDTLAYLKVHMPRYLSKAYAVNDWHMVRIRLYDKNENYNEQYEKIKRDIKELNLGYIVSEQWNREVEKFSEPIGSYGIRLLTFLKPKEIKLLLMGLEYNDKDVRTVYLDVFYHGKKISWRDIIEDKEYKKKILGEGLHLPKSAFFAESANKELVLKYAKKELENRCLKDEDLFKCIR